MKVLKLGWLVCGLVLCVVFVLLFFIGMMVCSGGMSGGGVFGLGGVLVGGGGGFGGIFGGIVSGGGNGVGGLIGGGGNGIG